MSPIIRPTCCLQLRSALRWRFGAHQQVWHQGGPYTVPGSRSYHQRVRDPYKVLGMSEGSSASEVKAAYYRLCRVLHPDAYSMASKTRPAAVLVEEYEWTRLSAEERRKLLHDRFIEVRDAYEVLSDPRLRRQYDACRAGRQDMHHSRHSDLWARERPAGFQARAKTREERQAERRLTAGVFGLLAILAVVSWTQRQVKHEEAMRVAEMQNARSVEVLSSARRRAMEKWREAPPGRVMEYEAARLRPDATADELRRLWPHGVGLGLVALLDDSQLC
ncbi:mdj1 protein precursor, partial [Coemansia thaxteri]